MKRTLPLAAALMLGVAACASAPADDEMADASGGASAASAGASTRSTTAPTSRTGAAGRASAGMQAGVQAQAQASGGAQASAGVQAETAAMAAHQREEEALRRLIAGIQSGSIDYSMMMPHLADAMRGQQAAMTARMQPRGAVQRVEHLGVGANGTQRFRVVYANESSEWELSLNAQGQISGLSVKD